MNSKFKYILILLVIYSMTLGIRIYWLSQKDGFDVDEGMSVILSCYNDLWTKNYELNREYSGKEVKEISLCNDDSIRDVFGDIIRLWKDNRDSPHTNLYYSFLRLSLAGLKTGDIKPIIIRGGILNLLFFTVSFVFFFLLMGLLFPDSKLMQCLATFCAFLLTATISNALFLRPYQIQETMFILFCYFFFKTVDVKKYIINDNSLYINFKTLFFLSLITAVTLLTGYYSIIFIFLFGIYIIFINKNNHLEIKYYVLILFLGLMLAQSLYLRYFLGFFSYRAQETSIILFNYIFANIKSSIKALLSIFHNHFFTWFTFVICVLCILYLLIHKQKIYVKKQTLCILIMSIVYSAIIILLAPYKRLSYIMPVFPFMIIFPVMLINSIKERKISIAAMLLLCFSFTINAVNESKFEYIFRGKPRKSIFKTTMK